MSKPYKYFLYSTLPGEPNVGIWLFSVQQEAAGQPVRLAADLVEWTASRDVAGGGPIKLAVDPYQYTGILIGGDEVYASDNSHFSQEWILTPANCGPNTFLISLDSEPAPGSLVWTAEEPGQSIKLRPFEAGATNHVFKFVHT